MVVCKDKNCIYCKHNTAYTVTVCQKELVDILTINEVGICKDKIIKESANE